MTDQPGAVAERAALLFRIAFLQRFLDERRALVHLVEARRAALEADELALASYCLHLWGLLRVYLGELREGIEAMERAVDEYHKLAPAGRDRLTALLNVDLGPPAGTLALWLSITGRLAEAVATARMMLAETFEPLLESGQGDSWYGDGMLALAYAETWLGHPLEARDWYTRARTIFETIEHHVLVATCCSAQLEHWQLPYFPEDMEARSRLIAAAETAQEAAGTASRALPTSLGLLVLEGRWEQALREAENPLRSWQMVVLASMWRARLAFRQGDDPRAWEIIREQFAEESDTEPGRSIAPVMLSLQRLAVELSLERQDAATARAWLEAHEHWLDWSGTVLGRAEGALLWGRYHHANDDPAQARASVEQALSHASDPRQPLALIAVHRFLGQLDTEAGQLDTAEPHLQESLKLAEACAAPFERALTLLELARLRAAQDRKGEAISLLSEVRTLCEPLEAKPTLAQVAALERQLTTGAS